MTEPVVYAVRRAIISGTFVPGQRLVEADLCARFSASRSAVRAALITLSHERLVERTPNVGAIVRTVSVAEAVEITEVRMVIEGLCAAKAAQRITDPEIVELRAIGQQMRRAVADGDVAGYSSLNETLHARVRDIAGQATAARTLALLRAQSVRHQFRLATRSGRPQVSLPEHAAIIDEICARSPGAAERAMRRHLSSVIDALQAQAPPEEGERG
jgi:DNA-binding GntR family transcriptional regulator